VSEDVEGGEKELPPDASGPVDLPDDDGASYEQPATRGGTDFIARRARRRRWVAGGSIVVVIALVAVLLLRSGSSNDNTTSSSAPTTVVDNFARGDSDSALGASDSGAAWRAQTGVWGVKGHAARVVKSAGTKPSSATVDLGTSDGLVRVTEAVVENGAGIVFRYRDANNYWSVQASPHFATWVLVKVINGKAKQVANSGFSATRNGASVNVQLQGPRIQLFVNGILLKTVEDSALNGATKVGLFASGPAATSARFTSFLAAPPGAQVSTTTPSPPSSAGAPTTSAPQTATSGKPGTTSTTRRR